MLEDHSLETYKQDKKRGLVAHLILVLCVLLGDELPQVQHKNLLALFHTASKNHALLQ